VGIITLLALGFVSTNLGDGLLANLSFTMASAIMGFFIWNYPKGLIFLGDGGAYLIGFWIATLSVLIVARHHEVSPWFALMINAYPILETLFTVYRRKIHQGKNPGQPDGIHFHSIIFRRVLGANEPRDNNQWFSANARTSPYLWALASLSIIPAVIFLTSTAKLIVLLILFSLLYIWLYKCMISFKTPKWIKFN
jgi:UDP-N-acetylmuramyl pentapeptide phosphotransferase/UDP-N-acetylglucosamine-1-phosphate transferase